MLWYLASILENGFNLCFMVSVKAKVSEIKSIKCSQNIFFSSIAEVP